MTLPTRYRLEAELGRGGMGVVYRAHDTLLDRAVAVKRLSGTGLGTEGRARLLREARAAAQLDHPNIVTVYDAGESDDAPFIVMQLIEGPSLRERPPQTVDGIVNVARQICAALDHAHAHSVVHRDLKPENILIAADGTVKLMDFGLARSTASRLTVEGALVGTVHYMAPEQALGQAVDGRADLYALGVMLYELAAGRLPFEAGDPISVISQHLNAPLVSPRAHNEMLPVALEALIVGLMSKRAEDRPASAAEVLLALEQLDAPETVAALAADIPLLDRIVRGRLVGRERELAEAFTHWQRAASGEGRVLLISGEPGIGKTRLTQELAARVEVSGGRVWAGVCYPEGGAPYASLAQIILAVLSETAIDLPGPVLSDLVALAPHLRARFPAAAPNPPLAPEVEQQHLLESATAFFVALAARAPLLLMLDDVHWADGGTLTLLRHLARRLRRRPVLIVATYREVELDAARPFHEVLLDLNRERLATRIKLARLNREQTRDLLAAMFAEDISPEFLEGIYRETEGNPFFVEEVCKSLIEDGKLNFQDGRWQRAGRGELEIPQSVRIAIQSRVGRLPEVTQTALQLASVLGREFDYNLLAKASDLEEDSLIGALESAEHAQLIAEVGGARQVVFAFAHALIPAALYEGLGALRRRHLHRRAAEALENLRPDDFEALARHFAAAGDPGKAIEYARRAAARAETLYVYEAAVRHLRAALDLLEAGGQPETRLELLEQLADIHRLLRQGTQSVPLYQEALGLWRSLPGADKMTGVRLHRKVVQAVLRISLFADTQRLEPARRASAETGLALAESEPPHLETVRLLTALSFEAWEGREQVDWDAADFYARSAVAMAEQLDAPVELSAALDALASVYGARGLFRERVQVALRRLALGQDPRFGDVRERVELLHQAGAALMYVGEYGQAMPHLLEAERLGDQIRAIDKQVLALRYQSQCWHQLDQWDQVLEIESKWRALEERYPDFFERVGTICFQVALNASVYARRGEVERARALREESLALMVAFNGPPERWNRSNHY